MKAHSKYRDILTNQLEEAEAEQLDDVSLNATVNATNLSSVVLHPDECDVDQPDEELENQLHVTQEALSKMQ